jgi:hypothetical protein
VPNKLEYLFLASLMKYCEYEHCILEASGINFIKRIVFVIDF